MDIAEKQIAEAVKGLNGRQIISVSLAQSMPLAIAILYRLKAKLPCTAFTAWRSFIDAGKEVCLTALSANKDDVAVIEYTGGTTGKSKGVLLSNGAANAVAFHYKNMKGLLDFRTGDTFLDILPPFYAYGIFVGIHTPLCNCLEDIITPDPAPQHFPTVLMKYKSQHFTGGPLHLDKLTEYAAHKSVDLSFVKTAVFGGDGMSDEWKKETTNFLKSHGASYGVVMGYGMTETAGTFCTSTHKSEQMIPCLKNNIKVLDIDTKQELGYNQEGEICVSGPSLMMEYLDNTIETAKATWIENGDRWLHTGDLGYISEEGFLVIKGRIRRILWAVAQNGVYRVYPMAIEKVINAHPGVMQCAVVGKPDGERGYRVVAYVVPYEGTTAQIKEDLEALCRKELPETSCPYTYCFVDNLPRTSAGKVAFRALEQMAYISD